VNDKRRVAGKKTKPSFEVNILTHSQRLIFAFIHAEMCGSYL